MLVSKFKKLLPWLSTLVVVLSMFLILRKSKASNPTPATGTPESELLRVFNESKYRSYSPYLIAQSKLESANYKSRLFTLYFNAFGMNCVAKRPTMQIGCTAATFDGGKMSKGIYRSASECAKDMVQWLDYNTAPTVFANIEAFNSWMKSKDFYGISEAEYLTRLKSWM